MTLRLLISAAGIATCATSVPVEAGPIQRGAQAGKTYGNKVAGPVGGAVGTVIGGSAYGFRSGASKVLGVPEETGSTRAVRSQKRKPVSR